MLSRGCANYPGGRSGSHASLGAAILSCFRSNLAGQGCCCHQRGGGCGLEVSVFLVLGVQLLASPIAGHVNLPFPVLGLPTGTKAGVRAAACDWLHVQEFATIPLPRPRDWIQLPNRTGDMVTKVVVAQDSAWIGHALGELHHTVSNQLAEAAIESHAELVVDTGHRRPNFCGLHWFAVVTWASVTNKQVLWMKDDHAGAQILDALEVEARLGQGPGHHRLPSSG